MQYEDKRNLSLARMEQANECLSAAAALVQIEDYKGAANRSYYAILHAMRAVLAFDMIDMKRHSGVISEFRRRYVKTEIFPVEYSDIIGSAFDVRTNCDYEDFYLIAREEAEEQIKNAWLFLKAVAEYLKKK